MKLVKAPNGWMCNEDPGEPGLGLQRWSVSEVEARIVSELLRGLNVLEIGTGLGVSTRAIAKLAAHVHTVDVDEWVEKNVELPENSTFYKDIKEVPENLDAAFVDGLHSYYQCMIDIKDAKRIVKRGGLIIFHDTNMTAIRNAIVDSNMECYEIKTGAGMALGWNDA